MRFYSRCFFILGIFFNLSADAQPNTVQETFIHEFCQVKLEDVSQILKRLNIVTMNRNENRITIEALRETHTLAMKDALDAMRKVEPGTSQKARSDHTEMMLAISEGASKAFKYGLCQRFRRPEARIETIATEYYLMCRAHVVTRSPIQEDSCF
jgi:hypothetical protein